MVTFAGVKQSEVEEHAFSRFPRLAERRNQLAGTMSGGEQQMLAMARGLAVDPSLLFLDELSMGLAPLIVEELYEIVGQIAQSGVSILVVEQFARTVLGVADLAVIMLHGKVTAIGTPDEIASADVVTTAVGPTVLRFVAPAIIAGLAQRSPDAAPLQVMACENAIGATDQLRDEVVGAAGADAAALVARAVFANTAVDRIVPAQPAGAGVDVTVEPYFEWAIESGPFEGDLPSIPGAHFVDDLAPSSKT